VVVFISGAGFVDQVEGGLGDAAEATEARRARDLAQALLASLRPEGEPTFSDSECGTHNSVEAA
jgi:hypothetical protein